MTKAQIIEKLLALGITFDKNATVAVLRALLPAEQTAHDFTPFDLTPYEQGEGKEAINIVTDLPVGDYSAKVTGNPMPRVSQRGNKYPVLPVVTNSGIKVNVLCRNIEQVTSKLPGIGAPTSVEVYRLDKNDVNSLKFARIK